MLGLSEPFTKHEVDVGFRAMAKKLHPDLRAAMGRRADLAADGEMAPSIGAIVEARSILLGVLRQSEASRIDISAPEVGGDERRWTARPDGARDGDGEVGAAQPLRVHIRVDLEMMRAGGSFSATLPRAACPECRGSGQGEPHLCLECSGDGSLAAVVGVLRFKVVCAFCRGTGYRATPACSACRGRGVTDEVFATAAIPPLCGDGEVISGKIFPISDGAVGEVEELVNFVVEPAAA